MSKPFGLRRKNGRETTGSADEVAGNALGAGVRIGTSVAIRHVHGSGVGGNRVGGHLRRARRMRNRTHRECGKYKDKNKTGAQHEV